MDNYWFLYNLSDGSIYERPYKGSATEWTNIPDGCGVIGFTDEQVTDVVKEAFKNPINYKITNEELAYEEFIPSLTDTKQDKITELSNFCNTTITDGFYSDADGTNKLYDFELENQVNISVYKNNILIAQLSGQTVSTISYYAKGEDCKDYTVAQFLQLAQDGEDFKTATIKQYKALKSYIETLTTNEEIEAVTWTTTIPTT